MILRYAPTAAWFLLVLFPGAKSANADNEPEYLGDIPQLVESAQSAGIEHVYDGPWEYFVGGGVAVLDCNGDFKPDLFFAGGVNNAALYVNQSGTAGDLLLTDTANSDYRCVSAGYRQRWTYGSCGDASRAQSSATG